VGSVGSCDIAPNIRLRNEFALINSITVYNAAIDEAKAFLVHLFAAPAIPPKERLILPPMTPPKVNLHSAYSKAVI
jgi:hypothetical protein